MVKKNFAAWHVNSEEFSEGLSNIDKLRFFARYAILAPSGHNTQPWHFRSQHQMLLLEDDPSRHLPYSGTQAAEPYVSLGACLETLRLAALGFGYTLDINYVFSGDVAASVALGIKCEPESSLLQSIAHRASNRNPYDTKNLPAKLINNITDNEFKKVSVRIISDRSDIAFIAEETKKATRSIMSDPTFRAELSKWVRNNLTRRHDGMPGYVQEIPMPPSLIARHIIKRFNVSKDQAKKDSGRVIASADLALIMVNDQTPQAFLEAGRLYAQICVRAQQHEISTSGVGAAAIDPTTREEIVKHFRLTSRPLAIIRLGKTTKRVRHTPRWPIFKVMD